MKKVNILISLSLIFAGMSVIDIKAASRHVQELEKPSEKEEIISQEEANKLLLDAAKTNNIEQLKYALALKADVNAKDENGSSALILPCMRGQIDIVRLLLEHKIDVNIRNNYGYTAIMGVSHEHNAEIFELLMKHGANINEQDMSYNNTLLINFASYRDFKAVEVLLKYKPDVNIKNRFGNTALLEACRGPWSDVFELLIKAGADIKVKNNNSDTALIIASRYGALEIVKLLLKQNINIDEKNMQGYTALMYAVVSNRDEIVRLLLSRNADVSIKNNEGKTVLDYIADKPLLQMIFNEHHKNISKILGNGKPALPRDLKEYIKEYLIPPYKERSKHVDTDCINSSIAFAKLLSECLMPWSVAKRKHSNQEEPRSVKQKIDIDLDSKIERESIEQEESTTRIAVMASLPTSLEERKLEAETESKEAAQMDTTDDGSGTKSAHLVIPSLTKKDPDKDKS